MIYIKVHYCIICKKTEICPNEECDFREVLHAHGYCYAKLSDNDKAKLDHDIEHGIGADTKESEKNAKRELYEKEYRKQWKENNPQYHQTYRQNNKDVIKRITKRYSTSEKGKAVRRKYADSTKKERAEYQKNYMREYRKKKKIPKIPDWQKLLRQKQINTSINTTPFITTPFINTTPPKLQKIVFLESKIKYMEAKLNTKDLTTQGIVNIQKLLMRAKTELKRLRRL